MAEIIDFKPKADLEAAENLDALVTWAKSTLQKGVPEKVHENIRWDLYSWNGLGMSGAAFTSLGSHRNASDGDRRYMSPTFMDFAKAIAVYRRVFEGKKSVKNWIDCLKVCEVALMELKGTSDMTMVSGAVCNRASELMLNYWKKGDNAYVAGKCLEKVIKFMKEKRLIAEPFSWKSPISRPKLFTLKQAKDDRKKKLPSRESLLALGEMFNNNLTNPMDIVVTSASAILLSQPSRVGELADLQCNPIVFKNGVNGVNRMFLRWYAEKGFGATLKPVMTGMEPVAELAIERMLAITNEAREYAAWLEDHPDEFPPHDGVPNKGLDDPLTYDEACSALNIVVSGKTHAPRGRFKTHIDKLAKRKILGSTSQTILDEIQNGWDLTRGKAIHSKGRSGALRVEFEDKAVITLRKLNVLVREKYLPKFFPYTTPPGDGKERIKYRDALFTVRTGALSGESTSAKSKGFGVEIAASHSRMATQLGSGGNTKGIFERYGYKGIKVNTHAFRHELNTEMHRANLSQLLIDAFSGRTSMGSVYNHETVEERTQAVAEVHPKTKQSNAKGRLGKVRTNAPLSLSDVKELEEGEQDRVIHQTDFGCCVHNWASEPCPKMGSCLRCGKLACVKGDEEKLKNIKEERDYLKNRYRDALAAESRGDAGSTNWVGKVHKDLLKCDALIKLLENPELEDGDVVWNSDDGWNLTNNALEMAGLVETKVVEAKDQVALPSLDELAALNDEIEV